MGILGERFPARRPRLGFGDGWRSPRRASQTDTSDEEEVLDMQSPQNVPLPWPSGGLRPGSHRGRRVLVWLRRAWLDRVRQRLRDTVHRIGVVAESLVRRIPTLTPERLFWMAFGLLLLIYLFFLVTLPTGAGRGGR